MPKDYWNSIEEIKVPEHLDLDIIKGALYIHNADEKTTADDRIRFLAKKLGDHKMTYVMALLVLHYLIEKTQDTTDYKDFIASKKKTIN